MTLKTNKIRSVEDVLIEYLSNKAGSRETIEELRSELTEILTQDRQALLDAVCEVIDNHTIPVTPECRVESAFDAMADDRVNEILGKVKTAIKNLLDDNK